jgi:alanine dehydrogenase
MLVGVPKEIKVHEYRVGLTPSSVRELVSHGHKVVVQASAGVAIGLTDDMYKAAGAEILPTAADVFGKADMIVKVKEPQAPEIAMLRPGQLLFTYLHLAPDPEQTAGLLKSDCVAIL